MSRSLYAHLARRFGPPIDPLTRREMLKASLAVGAGLLLSNQRLFARPQAAKGGKRVVVIGAGFGGLACAHELQAAGYDVSVVEARNRVGGRVLSFGDFVKDRNVEGGAELIGSNHSTWVAYADKFKLEFLDVTEDDSLSWPVILDGKALSAEDAGKLYEEMQQAYGEMNEDARKVVEDEPWRTPDAERIDKRTTDDWINGLKVSETCKRAIRVELTGNNGQATSKQSYLGNLAQVKGGGVEKYWTDSEVYRCQGGNQQLAFKLADAIGKDRVTLKLAVTEVTIKEGGAVVKCADGRTYECDDVVLAVPPSTWSKIKFNPELPAALSPQMGTNVKYLAAVKKRFWLEKGLSPYSLTDGDVCMTWEGTDNQPKQPAAAADGDAEPASKPATPINVPAVLVAFSGGPPADACRQRKGDARDAAYKADLQKLYPGYGDNFVQARFMDWPSDPWTNAGYSFPAPGQVTTVGPMLRKGLGRLHFAGEHTCYQFVGYMEGGLFSGAALAKRLAVRDNLAKQK